MTKKKSVLAAISPDEALEVLNQLAKDAQIRQRAEEIALAVVGDVDVDAVADDVFDALGRSTLPARTWRESLRSGKRGAAIGRIFRRLWSSWVRSIRERLLNTSEADGYLYAAFMLSPIELPEVAQRTLMAVGDCSR